MTEPKISLESDDLKQHRTITVLSRGSINLPLSDLMCDGSIEVFPHVEAKGLLFLQFRRGQVTIMAGKFIGLIPITPRISIDVKPKLPVSNLAHVLDLARASLNPISSVDRLYKVEGAQGATILEFLLRNFVDALTPVRAHGFVKDYISQTQITSQPRGHISVIASLQKCWSKGQRHRVSSTRFEQTTDTAPNRLLKYALEYALSVLGRAGCDPLVLKAGNEAHRDFPVQILDYKPDDYQTCLRIVKNEDFQPARAYYYRALEIALLILSRQGVSLERNGSDASLLPFVLDFEHVFEAYLRRVLELRVSKGIRVIDGNADGKKPLYDDRPEPTAQPDIILRSESGPPLIAEVKYKDRPDRTDVNQAITYAVSYQTKTVVILHQRRLNGPAGLNQIGSVKGIALQSYSFDMGADDLVLEEKHFAETMSDLANAHSAVDEAA